VADAFIEGVKAQIAHYQSLLEPLESGRLRIGDSKDGQTWIDRTQAQIDHLKRIIRNLEAVVERG
jgi:hypothetical protein